MSDHLDAPGLKSPNMDARVDITDIFAFQNPADPTRSVLAMNVNPVAPTLAAEEKGGGAMLLRCMILVLAVAALMAAMMAVSALPALAKRRAPASWEASRERPYHSSDTP